MNRIELPCLCLLLALAGCAQAPADDEVLHQRRSAYNTIVVTDEGDGMRALRFGRDGVRQSVVRPGDPDHLELDYLRAMIVGVAVVENPKRVLVVGLGGGSLPMFLHKHYPKAVIDAVDIDPGVVEVAREYFGFKEDERLKAHVADGRRFIEQCREPYDLIFLDAFSADNIPYTLTTRQFLEAVRKAVKPGGAVLANIWSPSANPLHDDMIRTYQEVFAELYMFDVRGAGNEILVTLPQPRAIDPQKLAWRAGSICRRKQFRFDLGDVVAYGFRREDDEHPGAGVLLDEDAPE